MTDERCTVDFDFDNIVIRDRSGGNIDPSLVDHGQAQFDVPADFIEQIVTIARRYAVMRAETSDIEAIWGAPIMDPEDEDMVLRYADGLPKYRFTTRSCFSNLDTIMIAGVPADFDPDYTDVIVWDNGNGITFLSEDGDGNEIVFGCNRHDFERLLDSVRGSEPATRAIR